MASVTKRGDRWGVTFRDNDRRQHWKVAKPNTRQAATELCASIVQELKTDDYDPTADKKTVDELVAAHRKAHVDVNVRESTKKDYNAIIDLHILPYFAGKKIRKLTLQDCEAWRANLLGKGVGRRTVNKAHIRLGAMLTYAVKNRWLTRNVALDMEKLRDERAEDHRPIDESILSLAEIPLLLEHADDRWRPLLHTAIFTGLRQGELLGMQWGDVDWNTKQILVRQQFSKGRFSDVKTKKSRRRVDLSDESLSVLRAWKLRCPKGDDELVFPHSDGKPLDHSILLRHGFKPALRRAKLRDFRFHDLRHTYASLLIHANVHPKRIQVLMGHSTIRVTMDTYGHLMRDADNEAANKITALVSASVNKLLISPAGQTDNVLKNMEAGVGIEPASTALQFDRKKA